MALLTAPSRLSSRADKGACVRPSAPASILSRPIAARSSLTSHRTPISKRAVPKLAATKEDAATTEEHKVGVEKTGPNFSAIRDINAIMQTLPHR
eukprot:1157903-Pelagomonas_calceolata.AAC.2